MCNVSRGVIYRAIFDLKRGVLATRFVVVFGF